MLRIEGVSKTYPAGIRALQDVTLEVPPGMFGLLGPNGAGKSTLMRAVATLGDPDTGRISFGDLDVLHQKDEVRRLLGYLPQEFGVYPRVRLRDMLDHLAVLKGFTDTGERREMVDHLLQLTHLWELRGRRLGTFSGGMRQRFGIAQALIGDPRLVIADEPTAGLDPEERHRFLDLLSQVGQDVVVILSTHIVDDVSDVCQGVAILADGRVRIQGTPRAAVDTLRGTLWRKVVTREELAALRRELPVLGTRWREGSLVVHVCSPAAPGEGFEAAAPDLHDLYLSTLKQGAASAEQ